MKYTFSEYISKYIVTEPKTYVSIYKKGTNDYFYTNL